MKITCISNQRFFQLPRRFVFKRTMEAADASVEGNSKGNNAEVFNAVDQSLNAKKQSKSRLDNIFKDFLDAEEKNPEERKVLEAYNQLPQNEKALVDKWMKKLPSPTYSSAMDELEIYYRLLNTYEKKVQRERIVKYIQLDYLPSAIASKKLMKITGNFKESAKIRKWGSGNE